MKSATTCFKFLLVITGALFTTGLLAQELEEEGEQLAPLYTSTIELGVGYTSADSLKFGEYNGLEDEGVHAIGNIDIRKHSVIGDGVNNYWELSGTNLGVDSRTIEGLYSHDGTYGQYGSNSGYSIFFKYDQIPHNQFKGLTPFDGAGTATQTLPANWVAGSSTSALTNLLPDLKSITVETERKRYGGGVTWDITDHWKLKANYRHENKEGSDPIGAIFGSSGGNPRSSVIARDIDFEMDEFAGSISYNNGTYQHILSYTLSLFNNNNNALRWDNPFNNSQWAAGSNFSDGAVGQMGYEPDNEAFTINYQTGFNFNPTTRFTANFTYGEMTQDDKFLPYTNNQITTAAVPLPRASLDGEIDTLHADVNVYTGYWTNFDLRARYTYDERDNNTPQDVYLRVAGDAGSQAAIDSSNARVNWPYGMTTHTLDFNGSYRFTPTTKVTLGYKYENKDRDYSEVKNTEEHTFSVKLSSAPLDTVSGWLQYAYSTRNGGGNNITEEINQLLELADSAFPFVDPVARNFKNYWNNYPLLTGHSNEHIEEALLTALQLPADVDNLDELFENDPLMRKFYQADRDRDEVTGTVNFYPNDALSWTLTGKYGLNDYPDTLDGRQKDSYGTLTLDTSYAPGTNLSTYAYFTYEYFDYKQRGFYHRHSNALTPWTDRITTFGDNWWHMDTRDDVYTVGGGLDWEMVEDKFNLKLDYMYSYGITKTEVGADTLAFLPYPDITTRIASINLIGDYKAKENMTIRFKYGFEHFTTTDFGLDSVYVNTLNNVILLGNISPKYDEHIIGVSLIYGFQQ